MLSPTGEKTGNKKSALRRGFFIFSEAKLRGLQHLDDFEQMTFDIGHECHFHSVLRHGFDFRNHFTAGFFCALDECGQIVSDEAGNHLIAVGLGGIDEFQQYECRSARRSRIENNFLDAATGDYRFDARHFGEAAHVFVKRRGSFQIVNQQFAKAEVVQLPFLPEEFYKLLLITIPS